MRLYWLDMETTSLDPDSGSVLEIAVAVSALEQPFDVTDTMSAVLRYPSVTDSKGAPPSLDLIVETMYKKNNLLAECRPMSRNCSEVRSTRLRSRHASPRL